MEQEIANHHNILKKKGEHLSRKSGPQLQIRAHGHISKEVAWGKCVTKTFGDRTLFKNISFHIAGGDRIGIIGPNGCGKSTLLKMLMKQDEDYSGELKLGGWLNYCYLGQSVSFDDESLSILEEIIQTGGLEEPDARKHLAKFQFYGDAVDTSLASLSGGERVRVYLAEIMLKSPHLLILDEPTNHLDLASRESIERAVSEFRGTVIAVSHDRYYLNNCVNKILAFDANELRTVSGNYDLYKSLIATESPQKQVHSKESKNIQNKSSSQSITNTTRSKTHIEESIFEIELEIESLTNQIALEQSQKQTFNKGSIIFQSLATLQESLETLYEEYESYES